MEACLAKWQQLDTHDQVKLIAVIEVHGRFTIENTYVDRCNKKRHKLFAQNIKFDVLPVLIWPKNVMKKRYRPEPIAVRNLTQTLRSWTNK